jgi:glucosamine--fructose-6-phosphate aminotransferase (isomerizing)
MKPSDTQMWQRIRETPETMEEALAVVDKHEAIFHSLVTADTRFIFTGCGTSYYLSLAAAQYLLEQSHWTRDAHAVSGAYQSALNPHDQYLVVAPSRSGRTAEVVEQVALWRRELPQLRIVSITADAASPLAQMSDLALVLRSGQEHWGLQSKCMNGMLLALRRLVAGLCDRTEELAALRDLPGQLRSLADWQPEAGAGRFGNFEFLGDTARTQWISWVALGASLSMAEISGMPAQGHSSLNYRHGPMSRGGPATFVTVMSAVDDRLERLIGEIEALGAHVARPTLCQLAGQLRADPQVELYKTHLRAVVVGLCAKRPVDEAPGVLPYVAAV